MEQRIIRIVAKRLKRPVEGFDRHARFREDLGADSLDLFEMLFTLEEELGVMIPDEDLAELRTLADVLAYLNGQSATRTSTNSYGRRSATRIRADGAASGVTEAPGNSVSTAP